MSGSLAASTNYWIGVVYSDFQANVSTDDGLSGQATHMANGTLSYGSPPSTWPGSDITYSNIRVNGYVDYTEGGGSGPTITDQPDNQTVNEGATATFTVAATGNGTLLYQWELDSGSGFADISGATSSSYTTPTLALADDGNQYRCTVTDDDGSLDSSAATLTVTPLPLIDAALVGARGTSSSNTASTTGGAVTAGDTLVAIVSYDPATTITSISDTAGNSYGTAVANITTGTGRLAAYVVQNALGHASNVLTVNFSGTAFPTVHLVRVFGGGTAPYDLVVTAADSATPFEVTTGVMQKCDSVVVAAAEINNGSDGAYASAVMDLLSSEPGVASFWTSGVFKKTVRNNAAFTASVTRTGSSNAASGVLALVFKAQAPSAGGHGLDVDFIGDGGSSITTPNFNTQASGSAIVACVARGILSDMTGNAPTDNKGNGSYTQVGTSHAYTDWPTSGAAIYAKTGAVGGSAHNVTVAKPTPSDEVTLAAIEVTGVNTVVDDDWAEDLTSPNTGPTVTTTGPGVLVAFWLGDDASGELNPAVASPWEKLDNTSSLASNHVQMAVAYRTVSGAGTWGVEWTPSTAQGAQLFLVALQQVTGGAAAIQRHIKTNLGRMLATNAGRVLRLQ